MIKRARSTAQRKRNLNSNFIIVERLDTLCCESMHFSKPSLSIISRTINVGAILSFAMRLISRKRTNVETAKKTPRHPSFTLKVFFFVCITAKL